MGKTVTTKNIGLYIHIDKDLKCETQKKAKASGVGLSGYVRQAIIEKNNK